jgi:hypothetical protein
MVCQSDLVLVVLALHPVLTVYPVLTLHPVLTMHPVLTADNTMAVHPVPIHPGSLFC